MQICIVGGTGRMGGFFRRVFEHGGWRVICTGKTTARMELEEALKSEVVMISVPIRETVKVIQEVSPSLRSEQLLCDLTSLKIEPIRAMLESDAQVLGLHPMFGPTVDSLKGQTIVAVPARCSNGLADALLNLLRKQGAHITFATPEEHDRMMAVVQVLTHAATLSLAEGIRQYGADLRRVKDFMSPVYRLEMGLIGRLLGQDPALYSDIMRMNPYGREAMSALSAGVERVRMALGSSSEHEFLELFEEIGGYFRETINAASKETDFVIRCMVEHEAGDTGA